MLCDPMDCSRQGIRFLESPILDFYFLSSIWFYKLAFNSSMYILNPMDGGPGGPQSMGSLRVGQDSATSLSLFTFMHWRRKRQPTPVFLPGESQGWGSLVAAVCGVAQSRTRLKRLSSSSSSRVHAYYHPHIVERLEKQTWLIWIKTKVAA